MNKSEMTDSQRILALSLDAASELTLQYAAPGVPSLENKTTYGLLEDFGRLNEARKALEKTENIVKERLKRILGPERELRGDNFQYKKESVPRYALNQSKAKEVLTEIGRLEECMETTEVDRVTVKRN